MTDDNNIEELAAEFVVGTLDGEERAAVNQRRREDGVLDAAIVRWEQRLAPLLETVDPVTPPERLLEKIQQQLQLGDVSGASTVISLAQHKEKVAAGARPWKLATGAMTALAACLAGFIVFSAPHVPDMSAKYVAVLQKESEKPAFLMTIDMKSHMCAIKTVTSPPEPDKSYELWMVHDTFEKPKSMGLIAKNDMEVMPMSRDIEPDLYMDATFAVTLEPAGGSPTGQPTGPIKYAGRLMQSTP